MQELSLAANPLTELLALLARQVQGLFDLNGRIGLVFILLSYSVAYLLYRRRRVTKSGCVTRCTIEFTIVGLRSHTTDWGRAHLQDGLGSFTQCGVSAN